MSHGKFTPTIQLIVESVFLDNLDAPLAQSPLTPVLCPEGHIGVLRSGKKPRFLDLFEALPPAGGKSGRDHLKAMLVGIFCRS